jgi:hypothetical protein
VFDRTGEQRPLRCQNTTPLGSTWTHFSPL